MVIYTCWNLWKERNRRIFNNIQESPLQVASRIKEDIEQRGHFKGHSKEGASKPAILVVYVLGGIF